MADTKISALPLGAPALATTKPLLLAVALTTNSRLQTSQPMLVAAVQLPPLAAQAQSAA